MGNTEHETRETVKRVESRETRFYLLHTYWYTHTHIHVSGARGTGHAHGRARGESGGLQHRPYHRACVSSGYFATVMAATVHRAQTSEAALRKKC